MIYFLFPETKGMTLEEIDYIFINQSKAGKGGELQSSPADSSGSEKLRHEERVEESPA